MKHSTAGKSEVEQFFLNKTRVGFLDRSFEKVPTLVVENYLRLGQLTALRFLEWIIENPEGVISLPTGKTPEFFIKWVVYYLKNWNKERKRGVLGQVGLDKPKPDLSGLHFVQMDEFFPIDPNFERSFNHYIRNFYIKEFGLSPERVMLIDSARGFTGSVRYYSDPSAFFETGINLDLRVQQPKTDSERCQKEIINFYDEFCENYENKIKSLGGIGFFLGGIGPDGHIAFNVRGSSHNSTTRLTCMNYETMAAAATDLGGIEHARKKAVITIGLQTITSNPGVVAIIMAAGQSKAKIVQPAIEEPAHINNPASCLQKLSQARFYITAGTASELRERSLRTLREPASADNREYERLIINLALRQKKKLSEFDDVISTETGKMVKKSTGLTVRKFAQQIEKELLEKIGRGIVVPDKQRILHTAPHHDDIELAYFPLLHHLVRSPFNDNHFCYLTSGYTAVTNEFVKERLTHLKESVLTGSLFKALPLERVRDKRYREDEIHGYLNACAGQNKELRNSFYSARLCRNLFAELNTGEPEAITAHIDYLSAKIATVKPGGMNPEGILRIKTWIREWEAELVWAHFGIGIDHVNHLRLQFYSDDIFPQDPDYKRDVLPIVKLLDRIRPDIVTLALDPEGTGPDTHYKSLMALRSALETHVKETKNKTLRVWGYRNVWSRFHPSEVNKIVPISLNSFAVLHNMFNTCFLSQRSASFPSHEFNGPFNKLVQKIWVDQFNACAGLLGAGTFYNQDHPLLRRAYGLVYLKDMTYSEFMRETDNLRRLTDQVGKEYNG